MYVNYTLIQLTCRKIKELFWAQDKEETGEIYLKCLSSSMKPRGSPVV